MECTILSPLKKRVVEVEWLDITTNVGNFVIQKGHVPAILLASPKKPLIFLFKDNSQENLMVTSTGIVHIMRDRVIILLSE